MDDIVKILTFVLKVIIVAGMASSVFYWIKTRCYVPRWVHYLAVCMTGIGVAWVATILLLARSSSSVSWFSFRAVFLLTAFVLLFPGIVYLGYGLLGGGLFNISHRINPWFSMSPAMNADEVISLLRTAITPYRGGEFEQLQALYHTPIHQNVIGSSGIHYALTLWAEVLKEDAVPPDNQWFLVKARIQVMKHVINPPTACISFRQHRLGSIKDDGFAYEPV